MIQISEAASLALHGMMLLAQAGDRPYSVATMAEVTHASQAHLAKVLQRLAKAGLVRATRGPGGGYVLARPGAEITLLEVYEAIEGPLLIPGCLLKLDSCPMQECLFGGVLGKMAADFKQYLANRTLHDLPTHAVPEKPDNL